MNIQILKQTKHWVVPSALLLILAGFFAASAIFAGIQVNTIHPVATVADGGRHLLVSGPVTCTAGERTFLHVAVTQRSTGAMAEGRTLFTCTGIGQQWELDAATKGQELFAPGQATAVALARTTDHGATTDAHQWLVGITLVGE